MQQPTPRSLGYYFPAEFAPHEATWLSWPHKEASWPGKIQAIYPYYSQFVKYLAQSEKVRINVANEAMKVFATGHLQQAGVDMSQVEFFFHPTNDAWCRDHGPSFLLHKTEKKKAIVENSITNESLVICPFIPMRQGLSAIREKEKNFTFLLSVFL